MKEYNNALIIGRFHPLCTSHLDLFRQAREYGDILLIAVGRPNYERAEQVLDEKQLLEYKIKNIFPYERTKQFLDEALEGTEHYIIPVQDIFNSENYASHVIDQFGKNSISIDDCALIGENQWTVDCFKDSNIDIIISRDESGFHATDVREEIAEKGSSDRLACSLTDEETRRVKDSVYLLEHIDDSSIGELIKERDYEILDDKINEEGVIYDGHIKVVKRHYNGKDWDVVVSKNACAIMYIDQEDCVYFTKQYRVPLEKEILELPVETMDKPGKSSLNVIVEGLEEECGIKIKQEQVHYFTTTGSSEGHDTETVDLFYAYGPHEKTEQRLEESEKISVVRIPFCEAYRMISTGEIQGSKTIALLQNEYIKRLEEKNAR